MSKLCQIVAIEKSTKSRVQRELTDAHHALQKDVLLKGMTRTYTPDTENGEQFPPETKLVQVRSKDMIRKTTEILTELFDITMTKDSTNQVASADIEVDGKVLLQQVPITTLLFLEKQLQDVHTFVKKIPTLDPAESWHVDPAQDCFATRS